MTTFEGSYYLLCALGDGALFYFGLDLQTGEFFTPPSWRCLHGSFSNFSDSGGPSGEATGSRLRTFSLWEKYFTANYVTAGSIFGCNSGETQQSGETTEFVCRLTTEKDFNDAIRLWFHRQNTWVLPKLSGKYPWPKYTIKFKHIVVAFMLLLQQRGKTILFGNQSIHTASTEVLLCFHPFLFLFVLLMIWNCFYKHMGMNDFKQTEDLL